MSGWGDYTRFDQHMERLNERRSVPRESEPVDPHAIDKLRGAIDNLRDTLDKLRKPPQSETSQKEDAKYGN